MTSKANGINRGSRAKGAGWLVLALVTTTAAALPAAALGTGPAQAAVAAHGRAAYGSRVASAGGISTVAGGVGGPANATKVAVNACGFAHAGGSVYFTDGTGSVRKVSSIGQLTTPVGTGSAGPVGDGGPASQAYLNGPCGLTFDKSGNMAIVDTGGNQIRLVAAHNGTFFGQAMTAGNIYTVTTAVSDPDRMTADKSGNLVITELGTSQVAVLAASTGTFYGQHMTVGHVYAVAGNGSAGYSGDGGPATSAELSNPKAVAVDSAGNLVIADSNNNRIRVVAESTGTFYGQAMTAGDIYTVAGTGGAGYSGDGVPATSAELNSPTGVARDRAGNLLIADEANQRIRVVAATTGTSYGQAMTAGDIYTIAGNGKAGYDGDGAPATGAKLDSPSAVGLDSAGNVLIADSSNNRVRIVAETAAKFYGRQMKAGNIYTLAGDGTAAFSGDGGPSTRAELNQPWATALDSAGNLVIADSGNYRIRVAAAATGSFYGQNMTAGKTYTVAGNGTTGFASSGIPATSAAFKTVEGVAVDSAGNLLIADTGNNVIRIVPSHTGTYYGRAQLPAGDIFTIAGGGHWINGHKAFLSALVEPQGVTVDGAGNLLIPTLSQIRFVAAHTGTFYGQAMTANDMYTVAGTRHGSGFNGDGGLASLAELNAPGGVAVDSAGNLLIADTGNNRIRVVATTTGTFYGQAMTALHIYTVAGDGTPGFNGDGGVATLAELNAPKQVAVDSAGNLLIADTGNNRIRVVAESTGTFYGQAMTAGHIYTIAGTGTAGFSGDGGASTSAEINAPEGVTAASGGVLIADTGNNRIRMVAG